MLRAGLQGAATAFGRGRAAASGNGRGQGPGPGQGPVPQGMLANLGSLAPTQSHSKGGPMRGGAGMRTQHSQQARPGGSWQGPGPGGEGAAAAQPPERPDNLHELVFWLGLVSAVGQVMHAMLQVASGSA